jgi:FkbM family methyltransferase
MVRWASGLRYRLPFLGPVLERLGNVVRGHDLIIQHGAGKGLRFNCGTSMAGYVLGYMEPHIQQVVMAHLEAGAVAYDLGANVGFLSMVMARIVGPEGQVVCFEPMPANAAQVRYNAALNGFDNIIVRQEAIADHDGAEEFLVDGFSSNHRLGLLGSRTPDQRGRISVELRTLDSVSELAPGLRDPTFIKMDIEGAEVLALRGAKKLLARARPAILIELHGTNREIVATLQALGYEASIVGDPAHAGKAAKSIEDSHWNVHILATPTRSATVT